MTESLNVGRDGGASTVPADGAVCAALAAWMLASYAGPCLDEIGRMEAKINAKLDAKAAAGPPAPASAMAGMSDQPTPRSMATVEERLGKYRLRRSTPLNKPWRARAQLMAPATRLRASRL
ncbi:MAG: hypothetical protein WCB55_01405 [Pseudolabrys sp.]